MQLILAIDSDPRRSEQLANLVRARLEVELVQATSAGEALHALRDRVPDLILTAPLLSPFDDGVLDEYLRDLGSAATHVQTLRIPMLSSGPRKKSAASRLFSLGRKKTPVSSAAPDGCDPKVFADEISHYLTRSLEERTASTQPAAHRAAPQPVDEWAAPEALVQEFREPEPIVQAPAFIEPISEPTHVPGSILDLRTPIVHPPRQVVVEPEPPVYTEPEPPIHVEPEPLAFIEPEPLVYPEPVTHAAIDPEPSAVIEPAPAPAPPAPSTTSASFEAALAAIRAAWVKPETKTPAQSAPATSPVTGNPRPLAGSGEVDLTNEVDSLEDVVGADGTMPVADDHDSPEEPKAPQSRKSGQKPKKGPEKPRGRKTRGADGQDVFDPNAYRFSALLSKLDEVTDSDEVTTQGRNIG